jgi:hypothetical protein
MLSVHDACGGHQQFVTDRRRNAAMRTLEDAQPTLESNIGAAARLHSAAGAPAALLLRVGRDYR